MLRNLLFSACILASGAAFAQGSKVTEKAGNTEIDYKQMGAPMPGIVLVEYRDSAHEVVATKLKSSDPDEYDPTTEMERHVITDRDLNNGAPLLVMMFNPTCAHCEEQASIFKRNLTMFQTTNLVLMAKSVMRAYLPGFSKTYNLETSPRVHVGEDSSGFIDKVFLYSQLPQINVYSPDRKLIKTFTGNVAIDSLKKYIE